MGISKSRMRNYYDMYMRVGERTLDNVYGSCSQRKRSAWECICKRVVEQGGSGLSVISHGGSWSFTTGYTYKDEQGQEHFVVDTKCYTEDVLVADL